MYFIFSLSISFSFAHFFEILYSMCFTLIFLLFIVICTKVKSWFLCFAYSFQWRFALLPFIFVNGLHYCLCMKTQELCCCDGSWICYVCPFVGFVLLGWTTNMKLLFLNVSSWSLNYCNFFLTNINFRILNLWNNYKNYN